MKKENILFGTIGILLGFIIGFYFANSVNRDALTKTPPTSAGQPGPFQSGENQVSAPAVKDQTQGSNLPKAPMPQVMEILAKAENEPKNFAAQMEAGKMYYRIERFDDAAKFFEKASEIDPNNYEAVTMAGNSYFDAQKFELAEKFYLKALEKNPDDINVRTDLGLTFFLRRPADIERAIDEYRKSLQIQPNHELTLQNLAVALQKKGDQEALAQTLASLEKVNPKNPALLKFKQTP